MIDEPPETANRNPFPNWKGTLLIVCLVASVLWQLPASARAQGQKDGPGVAEAPPPPGRTVLSPLEIRGRQIYRTGTTEDGATVTALMGEDLIEVPATALPCSSCHGLDGKGRPEGGVSPTELTWRSLTRPYGVRHPGGREHPPYDVRLLKRAISLGIDPAGNKLHVAMPRYRMAHGDLEALVAYLQTIDSDLDPGIDEKGITLGVLLPPPGVADLFAKILRDVVAEIFAEVNAGGGIFGREVHLRMLELPADPSTRPQAVESFLEREQVFALAPSFIAGADHALTRLAAELEVPVIAPLTLRAEESFPVNRQVFHLWSGIDGQGRALARFAAPSGERVAVVRGPDGPLESLVAAIRDELGQEAEIEVVRLGTAHGAGEAGTEPPAAAVTRLAADGVTDIFLLETGSPGLSFLEAVHDAGWQPRVMVPGSLAGRSLLQAARNFDGSFCLAYPTLPGDRRGQAADAMRGLSAALSLPAASETSLVPVFVGTRLLIEGLERAGRKLSRERLITALEGLYDYPTGLTPTLTFGPNRRVGARGAYVITISAQNNLSAPADAWVPITH